MWVCMFVCVVCQSKTFFAFQSQHWMKVEGPRKKGVNGMNPQIDITNLTNKSINDNFWQHFSFLFFYSGPGRRDNCVCVCVCSIKLIMHDFYTYIAWTKMRRKKCSRKTPCRPIVRYGAAKCYYYCLQAYLSAKSLIVFKMRQIFEKLDKFSPCQTVAAAPLRSFEMNCK